MKSTSLITTLLFLSILTVQGAPGGGFTFERFLQRHDANGDDIVTQSEFSGPQQMFTRMDSNKDHSVTRTEFETAMSSRQDNRSGGGSRFEQGRQRYAEQGLQPKETVPELKVYNLNGDPVELSKLWKNKPLVLVTASITCPISVKSCPSLKPLAEDYSDRVHVAVLYIREAHPAKDEIPPRRTTGARSHPDPKTFSERLQLAKLFEKEVHPENEILVDSIDNNAFSTLGAGPNIGLLINTNGEIILRQGWYEAEGMRAAVSELLDKPTPVKNRQPRIQRVATHRDLEYAVADGESLRLDLYLPEKTETSPPLVVWIHGGGWKNGDKANVNSATLRLSEDGYAVTSINYRLKDLSIHPKQIHDCKGAVRWLRAHADEYGYDATRIAVGGGSAGGHLALLLGLSGGVENLEGTVGGNRNQTGLIRAILDLYGPSELNVMAETSERFKRVHRFDDKQLVSASPLTYLTPDDPPILILHGDQDRVVSVEQSLLLHERYQKAGLISELHILAGSGHGGPAFSDEKRFQIIQTFLEQHL